MGTRAARPVGMQRKGCSNSKMQLSAPGTVAKLKEIAPNECFQYAPRHQHFMETTDAEIQYANVQYGSR